MFRPQDVPGVRIEAASGEDADLTARLVMDPAFSGSAEASAVLQGVQAYTASVGLGARSWRVNLAALECPAELASGKVALFMHGHGDCCCISTWGLFWAPMARKGYHLLAFDAPGFGRSEGATSQTLPWRQWDADLVLLLLRSFGVKAAQARVTVFGQCMGGAMFLRALEKSPETFAPWHVLHNCTIGTWPQQLPALLNDRGGGVFSFWWCDPDHMREANVFREFTALMKKSPELCTFVDLQRDRELPAFFSFGHVDEARLARASAAKVLGYCEEAVEQLTAFATAPARPRPGAGPSAPKKTMLQLGLENKDFKVFVRVRPPLAREAGEAACCEVNDVHDPQGRQVQQILLHKAAGQLGAEFVFERVFRQEETQDDVWEALRGGLDAVGALLEGVGATIFAYGQTGSGKTYTIDGDGSGLLARVVNDLYTRAPAGYQVHCQYVQLYNEDLLDLFDPPNRVMQDGGGNLVGAKVLQLSTAGELLAKIREGSAFRTSGRTNMNDSSSRSHAILGLQFVDNYLLLPGQPQAQAGTAPPQLFVVDLAGSERVKRSGASGVQMAEAVAINQSLFALANVTSALVENNGRPRAHIPYRDSALTVLLRNSLGGAARTALVACVSPAADSTDETLGTLRFAACATHVQNCTAAAENKAADVATAVKEEEDLAQAVAGNSVEFAGGEAVISTSAGGIHCYGNLTASSESPVVLMIHRYGKDTCASSWQYTFGPFVAAGCHYLAPDMPGHGGSSGQSSGKPEDYCEEGGAVDVILQVINACGLRRVILLGYDWGGGIACAFAARYPNRVQKLIAWCASVREHKELEKLQKRGKRGDVLVLWARNDMWHPYKKGKDLAAALGVGIVDVQVRHKGGDEDALARALEFIATS